MSRESVTTSVEEWESRASGADEKYVKRVSEELAQQINAATGMKMISIRLDESLIESFKAIGDFHGIGYQPLMRDALKRFANAELRAIVTGFVQSQKRDSLQPKIKPSTKAGTGKSDGTPKSSGPKARKAA